MLHTIKITLSIITNYKKNFSEILFVNSNQIREKKVLYRKTKNEKPIYQKY